MATGPGTRQFARAAVKVATELNALDGFLSRMTGFAQAHRQSKTLRHMFITKRLTIDQKMTALQNAFKDYLTDLELGILRSLLNRNLGNQLAEAVKAMIALAKVDEAHVNLTVYSAYELTDNELHAMTDKVYRAVGKTLKVEHKVDPALLGGVKLRLGNILVDGTIARRLELLREKLA